MVHVKDNSQDYKMISLKTAAFAALGLAVVACQARADDASLWTVHVGPAYISPQESATLNLGGAPVPGGNVSIAGQWSLEGEVGYNLTRNISIGFAAGIPPTFQVKGAGTLASLGAAGDMTGGPAGIAVLYHFNRNGRIQPYLGGGPAFLIVFGTSDGALSRLKASDSVGEALQAGADIMINKHWGLYLDLKKAWISTTATGQYAGLPVTAKVAIDPFIPSAGVAYQF